MATNLQSPKPTNVLLGCSHCGATLPDGAQFCLKCGKPVAAGPSASKVGAPARVRKPRNRRGAWLWGVVLLLAAVSLWVATSDSSAAQRLQASVGLKQDRIILDSSFTVGPHTFRYYKFALPEGSVNVAVVGQFTSAVDSQSGKKTSSDSDSTIEVSILTDSAFTVWQNGYATSSLYESGKIVEGMVQADVPAGAGIYYLVFSNKAAPKTAKSIHANVLLHYRSWLPDSVRRWKARVLDWAGAS